MVFFSRLRPKRVQVLSDARRSSSTQVSSSAAANAPLTESQYGVPFGARPLGRGRFPPVSTRRFASHARATPPTMIVSEDVAPAASGFVGTLADAVGPAAMGMSQSRSPSPGSPPVDAHFRQTFPHNFRQGGSPLPRNQRGGGQQDPVSVVAKIAGSSTSGVLRSLEEEWGTLMFFAQPKREEASDEPIEKLAIFGPLGSRCGAELTSASASATV